MLKLLRLLLPSLLLCGTAYASNVTNFVIGSTNCIGTNISNIASGGVTVATDNFSRADANPISNPMSDGTSTWLSHPGDWANVQISLNKFKGTSGNWGASKVDFPIFSANQSSSITINNTGDQGAGVRMQPDGSGYFAVVSGSTTIAIYKVVDSAGLSFFNLSGNITVSTLNASDVLTCEVTGTSPPTLVAKINGVAQGSPTIDDGTHGGSAFTSGQPFAAGQSSCSISLFTATTL